MATPDLISSRDSSDLLARFVIFFMRFVRSTLTKFALFEIADKPPPPLSSLSFLFSQQLPAPPIVSVPYQP
jgi:hypothetical protein